MIKIVKHGQKKPSVYVKHLSDGTTFTGTIKFKRTKSFETIGEETTATGLFMVTNDNSIRGGSEWVVVALKPDKGLPYVILHQIFDITVEDCVIVDLNIEVVTCKK